MARTASLWRLRNLRQKPMRRRKAFCGSKVAHASYKVDETRTAASVSTVDGGRVDDR